MHRFLACLTLLAACSSSASRESQAPQPLRTTPLTVERIVDDPALQPARLPPLRWLDGAHYSLLEGGSSVLVVEAASGASRPLVQAAELTPPGSDQPLAIAAYEWSRDRRHLLVYTNTRRVWRENTRGDYWVLDRQTGELRQLGKGFEEASLSFAKLDPAGTRVAYVHANDLWVEELASGERLRLTSDGSSTTINGTFDWVYEEELFLRDGFRWSPDGKSIAYWQLDCSGVGEFQLIDNTSGPYSRVVPVQYPKAGTTNSAARIGVVPAGGGATVWMQTPGDPRECYLARMEWAAGSDALWIQHLNREQNRLQVLLAEADGGAVSVLYEDRDEAWVETCDDWRWLEGERSFLWTSERDGWRHLWRVPRGAGELVCLTPGDYDVIAIAHADPDLARLYVIASPEDPTERHLYRVDVASGALERLTPESDAGTNGYVVSPDGRYAIHTHSAFGEPERVELVSLPDHAVLRVLLDNAPAREAWASLARGSADFFRVEVGDGLVLDGWRMLPPDFDPKRKWPVLFHVYGEPWAQTVLKSGTLRHYLWHLMLCQQGYVVVSIDNRGTPAPRGREWRKCVHGAIGVLSSADQAAAVRALEEQWDWIDPERVGIWGWSGGGSMTLNMLFRHPELYRCGIAVAPVADQRLYDTIYQERYMGLPQANEAGYRAGSPITFARGLQGDLLLVHGTGDDNVHYQGTEYLIDELVRLGKPFSMMAYPGRSHSIQEREGTRRHLFELMTRYLHEHLPAGPR